MADRYIWIQVQVGVTVENIEGYGVFLLGQMYISAANIVAQKPRRFVNFIILKMEFSF